MARPFLFGGSQSSQTNSPYLVQFKAGKMTKNGNTVAPIKDKKGLLYLHQSPEDSLMHFCWKNRTSNEVEDDLIIFPDDAEFAKVSQCTTGRVFVLKFKTSPRRMFFWSQEPKGDKDDEYVNKINEYINNPMSARNSSGNHNLMSSNDLSISAEDDFRNLFNSNFSAQQLMSMLDGGLAMVPHGVGNRLATLLNSVSTGNSASTGNGTRNSSSSTPAAPQTPTTTPAVGSGSNSTSESSSTTGSTNSPAGIKFSDLQNIISGLSTQGQDSDNEAINVDLSSSINLDVLRPLLTNEQFMERIRETLPQTSETPPTSTNEIAEQFASTIQSPQFQQALSSFSAAMQSGQLGPLIQQFGLSEECVCAANSGNFEAFVKALQNKSSVAAAAASGATSEESAKKTDKNKDGDKKDDDDEKMDYF